MTALPEEEQVILEAVATRPSSTSSATSGSPPLAIVGDGTNDIQRNVIVRRLVERSREG